MAFDPEEHDPDIEDPDADRVHEKGFPEADTAHLADGEEEEIDPHAQRAVASAHGMNLLSTFTPQRALQESGTIVANSTQINTWKNYQVQKRNENTHCNGDSGILIEGDGGNVQEVAERLR